MKKEKELIIIGAGIAGVSAAIYAKRSGLDFLLFESKVVGGQLLLMGHLDNYVGLGVNANGRDLANNLKQTLDDFEIPVVSEGVQNLKVQDNFIEVTADDKSYSAKTVIIATGASFKKLGVEGEARFSGKGVSYCAICDAFFFKNKEVAVVGGGNTAVEEALYLSDIAKKVTLIHRRDKLRAIDSLQKELFNKSNIEVIYDSVVKEMKGSELLQEVILENIKTNQERPLKLNGIFIAIGVKPNTDIFKDVVKCDELGFILADENMQTSFERIWSAGDCRKRPLRQLITAASEGAIASMSAYKYLRGQYISV